jgi:hypothetical protein
LEVGQQVLGLAGAKEGVEGDERFHNHLSLSACTRSIGMVG